VSSFRKLLGPGLATLVALVILLSLGVWQLNRRAEKEAILSALAQAMTAAPRNLVVLAPDAVHVRAAGNGSSNEGELAELTRVQVSGTYLPARSVPVRATLPATKGGLTSGIGFFWMTPLQLEGGTIVFINRGFVPSGGDFKAPAIPTPEGQRNITGLIRRPEFRQMFTPPDNAAKGEYFSRDPRLMALAVGLAPEKVVNFFVDAERLPENATPPVGVDPREMIARIPNNHLQYAVTWFGFALTLLGVFGFFARARLREPAGEIAAS
jgi:surfeit locus 1 family protein